MVHFLILLLALLSPQAQAAYLPGPGLAAGASGYVAGGLNINPDDANWFQVYLVTTTSGGATVTPFQRQTISAGVTSTGNYQVAVGKYAHCKILSHTASIASSGFQLMSDTVTFSRGASTASLTAAKYENGGAGTYIHHTQAVYTDAVESIDYKFEASTYPGVQTESNAGYYYVKMWCKEKAN